jgi:hypothetical protein
VRLGRAEHAAGDVVERAAVHRKAEPLAEGGDGIVLGLRRRREDHDRQLARVLQALQQPLERRPAGEVAQHLAGQPRGAHPRVDDRAHPHGASSRRTASAAAASLSSQASSRIGWASR